jgi:dTDP-4-amino-4,6-dideoxygalactose transaminase
LGDVAAFSFCQDKIMTTAGEGGMLVTNRETLWERAWSFKDHGKSYRAMHCSKSPLNYGWVHESFGTNWRLTETQSAIGRIALRKVSRWVEARRKLAAILTDGFSRIAALRVTRVPVIVGHAYYKYYVFLRPERLAEGWDRERILRAISAEGIPCSVGTCSEVYVEKAFSPELRPPMRLHVARCLGETSLVFLVHPTLSAEDMADTCRAVEKVMTVAAR